MMKVAADNYRDAGVEVPAELAERIRQGESVQAAKEVAQQAHRDAARSRIVPAPEAKPEVIHDLSTDEGREAAVRYEEAEKDRLLDLSNEAGHKLRRAEIAISELRRESYKGVSFDREALEQKTAPIREAATAANSAYHRQTEVWNKARAYADEHRSAEGRELIEQHRAARRAVVAAKSKLSILIHNRASEEEKEAARVEWRAAIAAEQSLKGVPHF
jgi:hypothetical protein